MENRAICISVIRFEQRNFHVRGSQSTVERGSFPRLLGLRLSVSSLLDDGEGLEKFSVPRSVPELSNEVPCGDCLRLKTSVSDWDCVGCRTELLTSYTAEDLSASFF